MPKKTEPKDTQSTQPEQVQQVRISDIHPFKNHPFKVVDDALMQETVDSIMQFGVLNPTIIRSDPGGGYEMVAGHRRLHASGLAGKDTIPAIVRNLTDDEAVILLVDTNLQRENISPMERAQAYKMKMEALKHQGQRTDLHKEPTSCQVGEKSAWAIAKVSEDAHQSERQVHRYLRLTELVPEIQKKVDAKEIAFNPAVELSYLKPEEQKGVLDAMEYAMYMGTLGNRPDLFGSSSYVGRYYGSEYPTYEIPPEALEDEQFAAIIKEAEKYLGFPYVWGGSSPSTSFDCSGFVSYVYNNCGLGWSFGRLGAEGLRQICAYVSPANAKPGDLIFFQGTYDTTGASHVGIYVGNNTMLHCGDPIQYSDITSSYWQQHFYQFGRLPSP